MRIAEEEEKKKRDLERERRIEDILHELGEKVLAKDKTIRAEGLR